LAINGLAELFPNVVYLPRAKYFSSSSLCLLPQVDAVWTIASNVGPVASFFGIHVGTPPDSHLSFVASAHTVAQLETKMCTPAAPPAVFDWMFRHYIIPWETAARQGWMVDYLARRLDAFSAHGTSLAGFCATQLEANDFLADLKENSPIAAQSHCYQALLHQKICLYRDQQIRRLGKLRARGSEATFVLLNNTAELESHRHIGCNHTFAAIQHHMEQREFRYLYSINSASDVRSSGPAPDWVLINGEGSFHHNSPRLKQLLEIALNFKSRGSKVALVNTIWEANLPHLADPIKQFDLVAARDTASCESLQQVGIAAMTAPDLSLGFWRDDRPATGQSRLLITDNIVYDRARAMLDAALHLDADYVLLDDRQVNRLNEDGCFVAAPTNRLALNFLSGNFQIQQPAMVVTGRFHVAIARVELNLPFVFVESNTKKISNLCHDLGIPAGALDVTTEIVEHDWTGLRKRIVAAAKVFPQFHSRICEYTESGTKRIQQLFSLVKMACRKAA
jgi:hypothetical protein